MKIDIPKQVRLKGKNGAVVTVDVSDLKMTSAQKAALAKLAQTGDDSDLSDRELDQLRTIKAELAGGDVARAFFVRFDLRFVRIDEPPRPR
jgi:hypothetical protein